MTKEFASRDQKSLVLITSFCAEEDDELLDFFRRETMHLQRTIGLEVKIQGWDNFLELLDVEEDEDNTPKTINDIAEKLKLKGLTGRDNDTKQELPSCPKVDSHSQKFLEKNTAMKKVDKDAKKNDS